MLAYVLWPDRWRRRAAFRAPAPSAPARASPPERKHSGETACRDRGVEEAPRRVVIALAAVTAAGCGGSSSKAAPGGDDAVAEVTLTDEGCSPAKVSIAGRAGHVRGLERRERRRSPSSSSRTTRRHHPRRARERRRGHRRLVHASTSSRARTCSAARTATPTTTACSTVTGKRSTPTRRRVGRQALARATAGYHAYVVQPVREAAGRHEARSSRRSSAATSAAAKSLFGPVALLLRAIEPVAESFGDLDPEIDARVNDVANADELDRASTGSSRSSGSRSTTEGTAPLRRRGCCRT